jgi:hypothetical protein
LKRAVKNAILVSGQFVKRNNMDQQIVLKDDDPTIFAKCPSCTRTGRGVVVGNYYARAFSRKKWGKGNKACPNCQTRLVVMYEVK